MHRMLRISVELFERKRVQFWRSVVWSVSEGMWGREDWESLTGRTRAREEKEGQGGGPAYITGVAGGAGEVGGKVGGVGIGGGLGVIDVVGGDLVCGLAAVECYRDGSLF